MNKKQPRFSDIGLIRIGICLEIAGIAFLSVLALTLEPMVTVLCMNAGGGLFGLGWLAWAWVFVRNL